MRYGRRTGFCRQLEARGECLAFVIRCLTVAVLLLPTGACSIKSPSLHWQEVVRQSQSRIMTPAAAVASLPATEVRAPKRIVLRITHEDPLVALNDQVSYAKLLRFTAVAPASYQVVVEAWCNPCPVTAILWGVDELPVFVPQVTLLDSSGDQMTTIDGRVWVQDPVWRSQPIKGAWQFHVSEPGLYYLLITSKPHGPTLVGFTRNFIGYIASPVGKIRVGVTKKE